MLIFGRELKQSGHCYLQASQYGGELPALWKEVEREREKAREKWWLELRENLFISLLIK
jgi:hypothetical protein